MWASLSARNELVSAPNLTIRAEDRKNETKPFGAFLHDFDSHKPPDLSGGRGSARDGRALYV